MDHPITESAAARVRQAVAAGMAPGRKDVEHALREAFGLSARKAKQFAAEGCKVLGGVEDDGMAELIDRLRTLEQRMK